MSDSLEQSRRFAAQALGRMLKSSVAPIPENYTLWYTASSGQIPDVSKLVEELEQNPDLLTQEILYDAYRRFFSLERESALVHDAFRTLDKTLTKTVKNLTQGGEQARNFAQTLGTGVQALHVAGEDPAQIRTVVASIMMHMREMAARQHALEQALAGAANDLNDMRSQLDAMRKEVATDSLTGLTNRKYFEIELQSALRASQQTGEPLCLAMIDIDHFKRINDNFGHPVGDQVLRVVATILSRAVPREATAARYGGEEFGLILPQQSLQQAVDLCESLRRDVAGKSLRNKASGQALGTITLSAGVTRFVPGESLAQLVDRADRALYTAKNEGRNRVCSPDLQPTVA